MTKRLINVVDCVFVGGVFEGHWIGLDEVEVREIFQKAILPDINKFMTFKFCTFFYKGNEYTSRVSKKPLWVFE
jgi:hypothetical protein